MGIPLIDHAFLPEHKTALYILEISVIGICLIIQLIIGFSSYSKSRRDPNTGQKLKFMFLISSLLVSTVSVLGATVNTLDWMSHAARQFVQYIYILCTFMFYVTLLLTLCLRLNIVFKGTLYEMQNNVVSVFAIIFFILILSSILFVGGWALILNDRVDVGWIIFLFSFCSFLTVYIIASFLSVRFFVSNLSKLAKSQADSQRGRPLSANAVTLNAKQLNLLNLSAKYILLFFLAILSSVLTVAVTYVISTEMGIAFVSIDQCINLFCLHLQFGFAVEHYRKCCSCLDSRCRAAVLQRTKKAIHKESLSASANSVGSRSPSSQSDNV